MGIKVIKRSCLIFFLQNLKQFKLGWLGLFFILSTLKHMFFRNEYYLIAFDKWQVGPFLFV